MKKSAGTLTKLALAFTLAACAAPTVAIPAAHANAIMIIQMQEAENRHEREIAVSPTAEAAIENGLDYSLSHHFDECKAKTGITETSQRDISTSKARDFLGCLRDYREIDRMNAPDMQTGMKEYDMSQTDYQYVTECRVEFSDWADNAALTDKEFKAVNDCVQDKHNADTLKFLGITLGGLAGGALLIGGGMALSRRYG